MLRAVVACDDFVGRREELAFLHEEFAAARDGRTRFVPIEGEAGIGKSRIAAEFLSGIGSGAVVRNGQCSEHVRTPYHPFATILSAHRAGRDKAAFFESALRSLTSESAVIPIAVAIEDVQWADSASIELLQYLIANLRDARVLFVLMMRTENSADQAPLAALRLSLSRARANVLRLHGLRRTDVRRLVERIATENQGSIAAEAVSQIESLSEGNPLFVEELARVVLESGDLNIATNVPLSIQAMLSERLASFSESERALLVRAAIVGQHFKGAFLARIVE
ncbi:MAG: AAA family ATPase, partial [Candidatus Eremiobacteraeota bacterium]|nr:AAA family ATPase [Candidatus Eremiobacteraeota bacterium]